MEKCICLTCQKRKSCRFGQDLIAAMNNLTTMVSKEARAQIQKVVAQDIRCGDYRREES